MEDGVIVIAKFHLVGADVFEDLGEFRFGHVGFVVEQATIADDEDLLRLHRAGGLIEKALLLKLQAHLALLVFDVAAASPRGDAATDEFGRRLADEQNGVPLLSEGVLDPAHRGGLARAWAAGDDDFGDFHFLVLFLHVGDVFDVLFFRRAVEEIVVDEVAKLFFALGQR